MLTSHRNIAIMFFLTAVLCISCNSQGQRDLNQKNRKSEIPQPTPIFYPQTRGPSPAILLLPQAVHNISGENAIARDLASEGYVARAVGYGNIKFDGIFNDAVRMNSLRQLVSESLASLRSQPGVDPDKIGIIGYSLGGFFATQLASNPDAAGLRAAVVYYGIYNVPDHIKNLRVPVLVFQGNDDFPELVRHAADMKLMAHDWKKQFEVVFYPNARHGFDRLPRSAYGKSIATDSWTRMIAFMNEHVKGARP
jgi:carboxymethylenebutenolidase